MSIRLITFDVVGTLLNVRQSPAFQYAAVTKRFNFDIDVEKIDKAYVSVWKELKARHPNYGFASGHTSQTWWRLFLENLFKATGYSNLPLDRMYKDLYEHFISKDAWSVAPGVKEALERLRVQNIRLGVVSNMDDRLERILHAVELRQYFDFLLPSALAGIEKPDIRIFQQALNKAQVDAKYALHVGDHLTEDYIAARKCGMHALIFAGLSNSRYENVDKSHIFYKFDELVPLVNKIST